MSETVMTFAFGSAHGIGRAPRFTRVFGELVVGGSGVYIFHGLREAGESSVRIRPTTATEANVLMSGLALADDRVPMDGPTAELATSLRARQRDIELTAEEGLLLAGAVAELAVSMIVTGVGHEPTVDPLDFAETGWTVLVGTARRDFDEIEASGHAAQAERMG